MERETGNLPSGASLQQLLASLQTLMNRVRCQLWEQRIQKNYFNHSGDGQQILQLLNRYTETRTGHAPDTGNHIDCSSVVCRVSPPSAVPSAGDRPALDTDSPLSRHLTTEDRLASIPPPITERMRQSVWEHIHCSIRYANDQDHERAQLHARLAQNALQETAHFMDTNQYQAFQEEIREALQKMLEHA